MEAQVKKIHVQEEINRTLGGWHTEVSLQQLGWTPYLVLQYTFVLPISSSHP